MRITNLLLCRIQPKGKLLCHTCVTQKMLNLVHYKLKLITMKNRQILAP